MNVLGISCYYHDSAACLVCDGEVIAAAQEERFNRVKGSSDFPRESVNACLQQAGLTALDVDCVAFYEKPFLKLSRVLIDHVRSFPFSFSHFMRTMPHWLSERLVVPLLVRSELGIDAPCLFVHHHLAHAASSFLASPFERAAILTVDGVGEWATTTFGLGEGNKVRVLREILFPDSLGLVYSAVTTYLGFAANRGEGKVMALADLGEPAFEEPLERIVRIASDGSFRIDSRYFGFFKGRSMYSRRFVREFGPPRHPDEPIERRHRDMAASLQRMLEKALLRAAGHVHATTKTSDLCIAGGVGLNCSANGRLLRDGPFDRIFVQPAAGDSGGAMGAALYASTALLGGESRWEMRHSMLGPEYAGHQMQRVLDVAGVPCRELDDRELVRHVSGRIADGAVVGWFQGRMEFGPRALGARSILADPRNPLMKDILNERVKHREPFRPYGASVLLERVGELFEDEQPSPFMLFACRARPGVLDRIPSALHVNDTCRIQTVSAEDNGIYHRLISAFADRTGVPMVINTSFNDCDEPLVCSPDDALACFRGTRIDCLVLGNLVVEKSGIGEETGSTGT